MALVMSLGAGLPGMRAVVIMMSTSLAWAANRAIWGDEVDTTPRVVVLRLTVMNGGTGQEPKPCWHWIAQGDDARQQRHAPKMKKSTFEILATLSLPPLFVITQYKRHTNSSLFPTLPLPAPPRRR